MKTFPYQGRLTKLNCTKKWRHLQWPKIGQEMLQLYHENIEDNSNIYFIYKEL